MGMTRREFSEREAGLRQALRELRTQYQQDQRQQQSDDIAQRMRECVDLVQQLEVLLSPTADLSKCNATDVDGLIALGRQFVARCASELTGAVLEVLDRGEPVDALSQKADRLVAAAAAFSQRKPPAPKKPKGRSLGECLRYVLCCGCIKPKLADDDDGMRFVELPGNPAAAKK